ncbi:DUF6643 family protein [Embleya hyalina]|nr:DUF6643 family protein [Embleya hyalina]
MTSARAYDGGIYSPYSETPIYDRLVAERGRPEIGPFNVPLPDFAMHPLFGERPALPALPALPSSYSSPAPAYGSSTPGYGYNAPAPMPALPAPLPVPAQYGGAPQYGGGQYNNAPMSGYASMAPAAPQAPQPTVHQASQPGAGQYAAQYVQPPQVPAPRVPNMGEPGQFPPRY